MEEDRLESLLKKAEMENAACYSEVCNMVSKRPLSLPKGKLPSTSPDFEETLTRSSPPVFSSPSLSGSFATLCQFHSRSSTPAGYATPRDRTAPTLAPTTPKFRQTVHTPTLQSESPVAASVRRDRKGKAAARPATQRCSPTPLEPGTPKRASGNMNLLSMIRKQGDLQEGQPGSSKEGEQSGRIGR